MGRWRMDFPIKAPSVVSPPPSGNLARAIPGRFGLPKGANLVCSALAGLRDRLRASLAVRQGVSSVSPPPAEGNQQGRVTDARGQCPLSAGQAGHPTAAVLAGCAFWAQKQKQLSSAFRDLLSNNSISPL